MPSQQEFIDLGQLLASQGIQATLCHRIFSTLGDDALRRIRDNPYELSRVAGFKFSDIDVLAGANPDPRSRIIGVIHHILETKVAAHGHTIIPKNELIRLASKIANLKAANAKLVPSILDDLIASGCVVEFVDNDVVCVAASAHRADEIALSDDLKRLLSHDEAGGSAASYAGEIASTFPSLAQSSALKNAFSHKVSIISSSPGCGKELVIRGVIDVSKRLGLKILLCAPTNLAAKRLRDETGEGVSTTASLIGHSSEFDSPAKEIDADVVVIEDASSLDARSAARILRSLAAETRLIVSGCRYSIPPIGAGNLFFDLVSSKCFPVANLKNMTQDARRSDILVAANQVAEGKKTDLFRQEGFSFVRIQSERDMLDAIVLAYSGLKKEFGAANTQIVLARKAGVGGVSAVNIRLHEEAKKCSGEELFGFSVGDKVIQVVGSRAVGIEGGALGIVTKIDLSAELISIDFNKKSVEITKAQSSGIELAYAITAHRAAGYRYLAVVSAASPEHMALLNRAMLFSILMTAGEKIEFIGTHECFFAAIEKDDESRRTGLASLLKASLPSFSYPPTDLEQSIGKAVPGKFQGALHHGS